MFCKDIVLFWERQRCLELENNVHEERELAALSATVVCRHIISVLKPDFRTKEHRGSNPVSPHQGMLRIFGLEASPLAFLIIEKIGADGNKVLFGELPLQVVDCRPLWR